VPCAGADQNGMKPTSLRSVMTRLAVFSVVALLLSGCTMRTWFDINVEEDGSGTFEVTMAFDEEFQALMEQESEEEIDWTDPESWEETEGSGFSPGDFPEGAEIRPYTEDDFEGFTVTVPFDSLEEFEEMVGEMQEGSEDAFPFRVTATDGRFELTTEGEIFEAADEELSGEDMDMVPEEMLTSLFDIQVRASLPGELVSHNADEVTDDGTLVWRVDPLAEREETPQAVSEVSQGPWLIWILIGAVVVVAAAIAVIALRRMQAPEPEPEPEAPPV
jgi:hypothetical protein